MMDHAAGAAHPSDLEYVLVIAAAIVLVWALGLALRFTLRPRETDPDHIKRRILVDDVDEDGEARRS